MMKSVPRFLRGPYRLAMRVALEEMVAGYRSHNLTRQERGWKLFLLLPRMLLHRGPRGCGIPRTKLLERFEMFVRGQWDNLLEASRVCGDKAAVARRRRTRRGDDINKRVDRAEALVRLGELSSARQALEVAQLAPGSQQTLDVLRDQSKRPRETRVPTSQNWSITAHSLHSVWTSLGSFAI